jgi:acetylornithine deacetylase/succinyl-diaminopimelate desuccinylase-like protein
LMDIVERLTEELWPGVPVIPTMSTGATDSRALRAAGIPSYGISGFFLDEKDNREHGRDERLAVDSFFGGRQFLYELVKRLSR